MNEIKIFYRRHLPHYQPPGYTFFITFRLAGSLPKYAILKMIEERNKAEKIISMIADEKEKRKNYYDYQIKYFEKFDNLLDKSQTGPRLLLETKISELVTEAINYHAEKEYDLIAYTMMPNHIHLIFTPIVSRDLSRQKQTENNVGRDLSRQTPESVDIAKPCDMNVALQINKPIVTEILRKLKGSTARECNKLLNRSGAFWQHESYDHVVRDENDLNRIIEYILNNPVKAGLVDSWDKWKWNYCKLL